LDTSFLNNYLTNIFFVVLVSTVNFFLSNFKISTYAKTARQCLHNTPTKMDTAKIEKLSKNEQMMKRKRNF
jgi:hypothetical protein